MKFRHLINKGGCKMKKYIIHVMHILCVCLLLSACTDELVTQGNTAIREGVPVTVNLNLGVASSKIITRAASDEAENTVNSVYVFAFNYDGSLDNKQIFTPSTYIMQDDCIEISFSMHYGSNKRIYAIGNPSSGSGSLTTNILAGIETEEELLACTSSLLEQTNIERSYFLMSGQMQVADGSTQIDVDEQGGLLGAKRCTHSVPLIELERVDARITFKIYASTTNSNYTDFTFIPDRYWVDNIPQHTYVFPHETDYTKTDGVNYVSMSDPAVDVQHNVEGQESDENGKYYYFEFYIPENRLQPKKKIAEGDATENKAKNLYALREKKLKTPATDPNKPGKTEENGAFEYANDNSTYVVFHGVLSYTDISNGQQFVYSDATYTVHLGSTGSADDSNNVDFVNDYNTCRNTHYTYTIHVTGVESMRVEVEADRKEDRPGIEGDLIFSGDAVEEMDAHYGRTQFTLTRDDIKAGLSWAIRTPFQSGMKLFNSKNYKRGTNNEILTEQSDYTPEEWEKLQTDLDLNDYKWVQFLINNEVEDKMENRQYPKYPGYAAYVGDDYVDDIINEPAPPFGGNGTTKSDFYGNYSVKLYDVNQLLNHLYAEAYNGSGVFANGNESVTITAFVDEYVYVYDPSKIYYRTPQVVKGNTVQNGVDLTLWRKVVNRDNRMLYLCTTGAIYSPDGETSVSRNVFTIAQRPIYTFYNEKDPTVTNGWGTESINETGPLGVKTYRPFTVRDDRANTTSNGLINTWNVLNTTSGGSLKWDDIMTLGDRDSDNDGVFSLNEGYDDIWHACIARNRDLNGDNIVQEEEVRWYLASIDQLTDLWIGEYSVNENARLYTWDYRNDRNGIIRSHVASSSYYNGSYTNPWKIWAEEGASRGPYDKSDEDVNGTYTKTGSLIPQIDWTTYGSHVNRWENEQVNDENLGLIHYRCVRNLGISLNNPETPFEPYVSISKGSFTNEDGKRYDELVISMEKMEFNSVRSAIYQDAELPAHTERSYVNRPYSKFAVIMNNGFGSGNNNNQENSWNYYQNHDVCPAGYRMPNQRELMLMYIYIPQSDYGNEMSWTTDERNNRRYMSGTGFGFKDYYDGNREGFIYETKNNGVLFLNHDNDKETGYVRCVRDVP